MDIKQIKKSDRMIVKKILGPIITGIQTYRLKSNMEVEDTNIHSEMKSKILRTSVSTKRD